MFTLEILQSLKGKELKLICNNYKIKQSGNKSELVERIISHQDKIIEKEKIKNKYLAHGAKKRNHTFENIFKAFESWCANEGFWPEKMETSYSYAKLDIREIRASFADYKNNGSVPLLNEFFEMLFEVYDYWIFFDTTNQEREFDNDSIYNADWLIDGVTEIYNKL